MTTKLTVVPEEQHSALMERMEQATHEYYKSIGMSEAYSQMNAWEAIKD